MGRVVEMRALTAAVRTAEAGGTAAISLAGEPGIGKTRLLEAACAAARERGFQVLVGRSTELEREIPYAMISDALDDAVGSLPEPELRALTPEDLAQLGRLLPALHRWAVSAPAETTIERRRCHRSVRSALQLLVTRAPIVLAFDDLHWADHASLEVLAYLLRGAVPGCLLILTQRTAQLPAVHAAALSRASRDGVLSALELGPLSLAETAELLGDRAPDHELSDLHQECGGNPFYLQELARARRRAGGESFVPGHQLSGRRVPALVQASLEQEIRTMSQSAQCLLRAAAVAGEPFDLDLAVEISALADRETTSAIDELVASQLVQATRVSGRLAFRHPLIRHAVYEQIGYGWRRAAHRRAAVALAARGADLSIRAHHLEHSSTIGDEEAIAVLSEAGRGAAARAPLTAARWFRAALRLLSAEAPDVRRLELVIALADALNSCGRLRESREVLGEALDGFADEACRVDRTRMLVMLAATEQGLGNPAEGHRLLSVASELVEPNSVEAASYRLELAKSHMVCGEWEQAMAIAAELSQAARSRTDRRLHLLATAASAYMATTQLDSRLQFGLDSLEEAARILNSLSDREIAPELLNGFTDVMFAEVNFERWSVAVDHAERGIRLCRETGHGRHMVDLLHLQAVALLVQGKLERALAVVEEAVETALLLDNPPMTAMTEATRCWALSLLGRREEALATGLRAVEIAAEAPQGVNSHHPALAYGAALMEVGDYARGREQIATGGGYRDLDKVPPTTLSYWLRHLVDAELELGNLDAAESVTRHLETIADAAAMMPMRVGDARYARARLEFAQGRKPSAAELGRDAVRLYEKSGTPIDAARGRLLLGRVLAESGDSAAAQREFDAALTIATAHRAAELTARVREARALLAEPSPGPERDPDPPVSAFDGLTGRQREIVSRVVRGMTNRQIAEELFVSEKTVEAHLSRLFAKVNVSSRAALAARAAVEPALRA
ncbi:helix-turn-helix transcriptional regulator [Nocardia asiatica]|uniref:helix-turn-helix transcriptional regulator n=1 Tax=Nocardia asiatica TaxID=209252 RepID=UPI002453E729|nr:LuxR family transcriptional regulator [Nocardia asiatica]